MQSKFVSSQEGNKLFSRFHLLQVPELLFLVLEFCNLILVRCTSSLLQKELIRYFHKEHQGLDEGSHPVQSIDRGFSLRAFMCKYQIVTHNNNPFKELSINFFLKINGTILNPTKGESITINESYLLNSFLIKVSQVVLWVNRLSSL